MMQELKCSNCDEKLSPESPYLGEGHRAYAYCKCDNCGKEFEAVYELVELITE